MFQNMLPRKTGPESVVLPLHHSPNFIFFPLFLNDAKVQLFWDLQTFSKKFLIFFTTKSFLSHREY